VVVITDVGEKNKQWDGRARMKAGILPFLVTQ